MPSGRDYVAIADSYAKQTIKNKYAGKWMKLAAKRYLSDRKSKKFIFDKDKANGACDFIELLPHVEGVWETPTLVLHESHVFFVVSLFGFRKDDGTRRFTSALFAVARKNAKSTLAAAIGLYVLTCEGEVGPQVISAATTGDQARIVWKIAKAMVERTPALQEAFGIQPMANAIPCFANGGTFKPINAKASTQDGLNPSTAIMDEIHAHPTHDLINVLTSAAGARKQPLFLYTTTEGYENPGPWREQREFAKRVLDGAVEADHFLAFYFAIDDDDDDFDERCWQKANPLMSVNPLILKTLQKEAIEAKAMPGKMAEFRIKRLNRPASGANAWVNLHDWRACSGPVDLKAMEGLPCWAAFDLASTRDTTAWRMVWRDGDQFYTWGRYWVPDAAIHQRTARGSANYAGWCETGLITRTDGNVTDYSVVERDIKEDFERFNPSQVGFDSWNSTDLVNRLTDAGLPMVQFIQGPKSFNPAMQALERSYLSHQLSHGGDPVLQWHAANLIPRLDANNNQAPDKKRSADKIDGMVALLMAFGLAAADEGDGDIMQSIINPLRLGA